VAAIPCPKCQTTLSDDGSCVTCAAAAEGLVRLLSTDFGTVRDAMTRLEEAGLGPEMEQVPAATPAEARQPRWNLYVPAEQVEDARRHLVRDWTQLVEGEEAVQASQRGEEILTLDGSAEIACPACGNRFTPAGPDAECPDCGLGLGAPGGAGDDH
jgi:hypothetical protein